MVDSLCLWRLSRWRFLICDQRWSRIRRWLSHSRFELEPLGILFKYVRYRFLSSLVSFVKESLVCFRFRMNLILWHSLLIQENQWLFDFSWGWKNVRFLILFHFLLEHFILLSHQMPIIPLIDSRLSAVILILRWFYTFIQLCSKLHRLLLID